MKNHRPDTMGILQRIETFTGADFSAEYQAALEMQQK